MVSLMGPAGTGKTLLALACGLRKVFDEGVYGRILVSRPIVPLGRDIGYPREQKKKSFSIGCSRFMITWNFYAILWEEVSRAKRFVG
jgi:hypothetical protein